MSAYLWWCKLSQLSQSTSGIKAIKENFIFCIWEFSSVESEEAHSVASDFKLFPLLLWITSVQYQSGHTGWLKKMSGKILEKVKQRQKEKKARI